MKVLGLTIYGPKVPLHRIKILCTIFEDGEDGLVQSFLDFIHTDAQKKA